MSDKLEQFWELNKTPLALMVEAGRSKYGLQEEQIIEAAKRVYEEAKEILETTEEPKPLHSQKSFEKIILARNRLEPARLARRVYEVAKTVRPESRRKKKRDGDRIEGRLERIEAYLFRRRWWQKLINWSKYDRWE